MVNQLEPRGPWNKTISVPLPNFGDNRKVFVKVIEKDIAELQQYQALYQQQQPFSHVQSQQQQQLSQQHFQQQQQLNQHHFQQQQQLNQQQFQQQQQCQQQCQQQLQHQQQCPQQLQYQQGQRVFGQNLMDNVYVNLFDSMSPMQQSRGNTYFKLLDTTHHTVDGNIYVKVPQSELLNTPSGMVRNISHAPAFFKVLDPSMIAPKSGITQNQVFFKVFDSNPYANKIYVQGPLEQQQQSDKAVLVAKTLGEAELEQLRQNIKVLDRDMLIDTLQQPTLGSAAARVLCQTTPLSPLEQQQQSSIQVIETCTPFQQVQQGNVVFLNQGMDKQWLTIPAGQVYNSEHGNIRLKIAIDPAEALHKQLINQQQQGEWIAVNPARRQGTMFLNITVDNPLKSRL